MSSDSALPKSFILRYWKGAVALPVAFWLIGGALILLPLFLPPLVDLMAGDEGHDPRIVLAAIATMSAGALLVLSWWAIGLWRSAGRHRQLAKVKGAWTLWSHLARFVIISICLGLVPALAVRSAPLVIELYKVGVLGDPDIPPYKIRALAGGTQVEVSGGIKHGLAADLAQVLEAHPQARILHLNSGGGRVGEAQQLFNLVRSRRLDTFVRYSCTSACTSIFLAGAQRLVEPSGRLGFHSVSFPGMTAEDQRSSDREWSSQMLLAGVAPAFIEQAVRVPAASMWYPSLNELLAAHVVTSIVPPGSMPASAVAQEQLDRALEAGGARSFLLDLGGSYLLDALGAYPSERDDLLTSVQAKMDEGSLSWDNLAPLDPLVRNLARQHAAGLPSLHEAGAIHVLELYASLFSRFEVAPEGVCQAFLQRDYPAIEPDQARLVLVELLTVTGRVVRASTILPPAGAAVPLISPVDWQSFLSSGARHGLSSEAADSLEKGGEGGQCSDFGAAIGAALSMDDGAGRRVRGHLLRLLANL